MGREGGREEGRGGRERGREYRQVFEILNHMPIFTIKPHPLSGHTHIPPLQVYGGHSPPLQPACGILPHHAVCPPGHLPPGDSQSRQVRKTLGRHPGEHHCQRVLPLVPKVSGRGHWVGPVGGNLCDEFSLPLSSPPSLPPSPPHSLPPSAPRPDEAGFSDISDGERSPCVGSRKSSSSSVNIPIGTSSDM